MEHISETIDDILTEWAYQVNDGMPDVNNPLHMAQLEHSLNDLEFPPQFIVEFMSNLRGKKQVILEKKGDTSATTFYHEVITGIIVAGGKEPFKTGEDVKKWFDNGKIKAVQGSGASPTDVMKLPQARFLEKDSIPKGGIVSDAIKVGTAIVKNLGRGKKVMWTGPTNDASRFGAGDIGATFSGYGEVGVSLKKGKGQLKNLTLGTFTKTLGLTSMTGTSFVKEYSSNFDSLTQDWATLVTSLFNNKSTDKNANKIFKKHIKSSWGAYQKEKISQDDLDTLTSAVGMNKIEQKSSKQKTFKYFCRKMQEKFHPQWKEWQSKRGKHFDNIFGSYLKKYDVQIRENLSNLFKKQLSVGDTSLFYAAKGGKTFWFIPSEKLYDKEMGPDEFIADYELQESKAGYKVFLDVGTQTAGGIGTIIIEIRFAMGQMDGTPDVKSSYKLVAKDWSGLLGVFRK